MQVLIGSLFLEQGDNDRVILDLSSNSQQKVSGFLMSLQTLVDLRDINPRSKHKLDLSSLLVELVGVFEPGV